VYRHYKYHWHHVTPKYLGGFASERRYINAAYHQLVTNQIPEAWRYGTGLTPTPIRLAEILKDVYDESTACKRCGSGALQQTHLVLRPSSLSKLRNLAIAITIGGEIVVSDSFAELIATHGFQGAVLRPVNGRRRSSHILPGWQQLYGTSHLLNIVAPTRMGIGPTDDDAAGEYRCPQGHTIGLNLLSELWVSKDDVTICEWDLAFTRQRVGTRRGLLRPQASLLISPRFWRALKQQELKGYDVEVAHVK